MSEPTYRIIKFFFNKPNKVIKRGLSLEEAQKHCNDPETSSTTCKNNPYEIPWFDGYEKE